MSETAQQTFEELLLGEGKVYEYANLSAMAALPRERLAVVEQLIDASEQCRRKVDSLLIAFEAMPEAYRPVIKAFEELRRKQLLREDGWKKLSMRFRGGKPIPEGVMQSVATLAGEVDRPIQMIFNYLEGMSAADAIGTFFRRVVSDCGVGPA